MINFTINNISANIVTYQTTTINAGESALISTNQFMYAADGNLLSDLLTGNITISINGNVLYGNAVLTLLSLFASVGGYGYRNITGNATTVVKPVPGRLNSIVINKNWTGGTVTIYDNTSATGTIIGTIDVGTPSGGLLSSSGIPGPVTINFLNIETTTGLTIVTSGSTSNNITVIYR